MPKVFPFDDAWYRNASLNKDGEPAPLDVGYCIFKPGQVRFLTARERHAANEPFEAALVNGRLLGPFATQADAESRVAARDLAAEAAEAERVKAELAKAAADAEAAERAKAEAEAAKAAELEAAAKTAEPERVKAEAEAEAATKTVETEPSVETEPTADKQPETENKASDDDWGDEAPKAESKPVSKPSSKKGK